jgi:hypothetical protein
VNNELAVFFLEKANILTDSMRAANPPDVAGHLFDPRENWGYVYEGSIVACRSRSTLVFASKKYFIELLIFNVFAVFNVENSDVQRSYGP